MAATRISKVQKPNKKRKKFKKPKSVGKRNWLISLSILGSLAALASIIVPFVYDWRIPNISIPEIDLDDLLENLEDFLEWSGISRNTPITIKHSDSGRYVFSESYSNESPLKASDLPKFDWVISDVVSNTGAENYLSIKTIDSNGDFYVTPKDNEANLYTRNGILNNEDKITLAPIKDSTKKEVSIFFNSANKYLGNIQNDLFTLSDDPVKFILEKDNSIINNLTDLREYIGDSVSQNYSGMTYAILDKTSNKYWTTGTNGEKLNSSDTIDYNISANGGYTGINLGFAILDDKLADPEQDPRFMKIADQGTGYVLSEHYNTNNIENQNKIELNFSSRNEFTVKFINTENYISKHDSTGWTTSKTDPQTFQLIKGINNPIVNSRDVEINSTTGTSATIKLGILNPSSVEKIEIIDNIDTGIWKQIPSISSSTTYVLSGLTQNIMYDKTHIKVTRKNLAGNYEKVWKIKDFETSISVPATLTKFVEVIVEPTTATFTTTFTQGSGSGIVSSASAILTEAGQVSVSPFPIVNGTLTYSLLNLKPNTDYIMKGTLDGIVQENTTTTFRTPSAPTLQITNVNSFSTKSGNITVDFKVANSYLATEIEIVYTHADSYYPPFKKSIGQLSILEGDNTIIYNGLPSGLYKVEIFGNAQLFSTKENIVVS